MKNIFPLIFIFIFLLSGCSKTVQEENINYNILKQNNNFEQNLQCANLLEQSKNYAMESYGKNNQKVDFYKIFYSPKENTCIYAIMVYKKSTNVQEFILIDALTQDWIHYISSAKFQDFTDPFYEAAVEQEKKIEELLVNK